MSSRSYQSLTLEISVYVGPGYIKVWPDPAEVVEGGTVEWQIQVEPTLPSLAVEVYFSGRSPTNWSTRQIHTQPSTHGGISSITAIVNDSGEYKYGVKATEVMTHQVLADDDPYLIVRPK